MTPEEYAEKMAYIDKLESELVEPMNPLPDVPQLGIVERRQHPRHLPWWADLLLVGKGFIPVILAGACLYLIVQIAIIYGVFE